MIHFIKSRETARLPEYKSLLAVGADLYSSEDVILLLHRPTIVHTGLQLANCPEDFELQIRSRSGLAASGIFVCNSPGTIDPDYRGEIKVILMNLCQPFYKVAVGERIAQMVVAARYRENFQFTSKIVETTRGVDGLGSTGKE